MRKAALRLILVLVVMLVSVVAGAQQPVKASRVGFLSSASPSVITPRIEALRKGLRELGYTEGKNLIVLWRYAEGTLDRLPTLAAELVRLKVDIIISASPPVTRAVRDATTTIPIVMAQDPDPVGNGFVTSLARPGGNITGLASLTPELSGKRLELLKETIPKLARLAIVGTSTEPGYADVSKNVERAAAALKVQLQYEDVLNPQEIEGAFRAASKAQADAVLVLNSPFLISHRKLVTDLAVKNRLPTMYYSTEFVDDGGLMTYSVSFSDLFFRTATYIDKILKGAKPADLPVEQPKKFDFVINLKSAKQIGLTIPPNVLARADRVIR